MFKKNPETESARVEPTTTKKDSPVSFKVSTRPSSVIGPTLIFKGELSADEDLIIEGTIEGTIAHQQKNLVVGKQGRVKADIHAKEAVIEGNVVGDIRGDERVVLAEGADVTGNITSPRVQIADGARFNGSIKTTSRPSDAAVTKLPEKATPKAQTSGAK